MQEIELDDAGRRDPATREVGCPHRHGLGRAGRRADRETEQRGQPGPFESLHWTSTIGQLTVAASPKFDAACALLRSVTWANEALS